VQSITYVMFNLHQRVYVFIGVSLLVSRITRNCSTDFHRSWWKGGTWPWKKPLDFGGNLDHITLGLEWD